MNSLICKALLIAISFSAALATSPPYLGWSNQCVYRGRAYKDGEKMPQLQEDNPCRIGCYCLVNEGMGHVQCAQINCPVYFNMQAKWKPGCVLIHKKNSCCPILKCPRADGTFQNPGAICTYKNETYIQGQYIKGIEDPCITCRCVPGFNGPYGPGCKPVHCLNEPPSLGCVPQYDKRFCCASSYKCRS